MADTSELELVGYYDYVIGYIATDRQTDKQTIDAYSRAYASFVIVSGDSL
jgi:hypothetical protein